MVEFNMYDAKTNFSKIAKLLENKEEDVVIINRNNMPLLEIRLIKKNGFILGGAEGLIDVPDDFDEWDISSEFEGEIFPK